MLDIVPGVYAITATPFDEQGRLDEDSIASLVEFEVRAGVHGLNILGIMEEGTEEGTLREKSDISAETQPAHLMCGGCPACHADHGWMPPGSCTM